LNGFDAGCFTNIGFAIDDEILCKEKGVYRWAARAECDQKGCCHLKLAGGELRVRLLQEQKGMARVYSPVGALG